MLPKDHWFVKVLAYFNKTLDDITVIKVENSKKEFEIDKNEFFTFIKDRQENIEIDDEELEKLLIDIVIIGNGWWITREEDDGLPYYYLHTPPSIPDKKISIKEYLKKY